MMFTFTINSSNVGVSTVEDISELVREVSEKISYGELVGVVRDYNGNAVGDWLIQDLPEEV